jgi:hypothetical protein
MISFFPPFLIHKKKRWSDTPVDRPMKMKQHNLPSSWKPKPNETIRFMDFASLNNNDEKRLILVTDNEQRAVGPDLS